MTHTRFFRLDPRHLLLSLLLLLILVAMALWLRDPVVRPFVGDLLAVVWLHLLIQSVCRVPWWVSATGALGVACTLEGLQYARLVERMGWQESEVARVVFGMTFDPLDLPAYLVGWACVMGVRWVQVQRGA